MRIVHVTATFPPYKGGTGNVAYHNALELARRGHDVRVVTAGQPNSAAEDPPGVAVQRLMPHLRVGNAPFAPALTRALAGADLIHLHYPFYFGAEQVWLSCRRTRTPYLITYHQDVIFAGPMTLAARVHHALLGERVLRGASLVMATTLDYAAHSRLARLPRERLAELPNGVDVTRFHPDVDPRSLRARWNLPPDDTTVLFVGALDRAHYFKGVPLLLRALTDLPRTHLLLVGDGDLRLEFQNAATAAGLAERVHFAGRVPDQELPAYYALADLTVLPSTTMGEAFGLVLLESLASGTPVVASRLPGVRIVVDEGLDGLLAAPGHAGELSTQLGVLLADPERRRRMGAAGRRKVEQRYAWSRIGDQLVQRYAEVLGVADDVTARGGA